FSIIPCTVIVVPVPTDLQHLFDDVPHTALPSVFVGYIGGNRLDLGHRVLWGTGKAHQLHGRDIGKIVPHIEHISRLDIIEFQIFFQWIELVMGSHIEIGHPQPLQAFLYPLVGASGDYTDIISFLDGGLDGEAVLDTHSAKQLPRGGHQHRSVGEHSVHIEDEGGDVCQ